MGWCCKGLLLFFFCQAWAPGGRGAEPAEPTAEPQLRRGDSLTAQEIERIIGQILQEDLQKADPTGESPLAMPDPEEKTANSTDTKGGADQETTVEVLVKAKEEEVAQEEEKEEEVLKEQDEENGSKEEEREVEEEENEQENEESLEEVSPTTAEGTTSAVEDNFSYIFSRLSAIESAIHRLNVQFYGMDVKMSQYSQNFAKLRSKLDDTQDTLTSVSEMNLRNQRHIGQIEGCLKGRRVSRRCYLFFRHFESYSNAQELCHSRGGNLAMPIDQQEYAALAKYIHESLYPFNWPVWIGINDRRSEGMYLYENGHRVSYFNWYKDPLVTQPNGGILENCVSISSDDGKWWDNDCTRRMYYVCEY
ncbi:C-type lectin domain family 11 member A [Ambystoma mexicanum]|uniref:C-type lectin domain family 11 member A n=1 Tax=Ambystoma mexicanum TaxID=8296 RepID=UPI0037E85F76